MRIWLFIGALCLAAIPAVGQTPNLNGIWQSLNTANWDIQGHSAQAGNVVSEGARGAEPAGLGIVEGEEIPYLPAALAQKKKNWEHRFTDDPEITTQSEEGTARLKQITMALRSAGGASGPSEPGKI